jgi:hypothetical protein
MARIVQIKCDPLGMEKMRSVTNAMALDRCIGYLSNWCMEIPIVRIYVNPDKKEIFASYRESDDNDARPKFMMFAMWDGDGFSFHS